MVLHRIWEELHSSSPGDSTESCDFALGHCASLHVHGFLRTLFSMGMRCQRQPVTKVSTNSVFWTVKDSLWTMFLREREPRNAIHASGGLSVLFGSVIAGTDLLSLVEPLWPPGSSTWCPQKMGFSLCFTFSLSYNLCLLPLVLSVGTLEKSPAPTSSFPPRTFRKKHIF